jgi:DNA (cytosine-5)-methyltransferase 1
MHVTRRRPVSSSPLRAVSLFSNCGAGDLGYAKAGFEFDVLAELDERRLSIAALNLPGGDTVPGDLRETWPDVVKKYQARNGKTPPALLAACPPCQGMSSARSGRGRADDPDAGSRDQRNLLVQVIAKVAHALQPRIVVVENVPAFLSRVVRHPRTDDPISAAVLLVRSLRQRYYLSALLTDLADYGVPQSRRRGFLCFVRRDEKHFGEMVQKGRVPFPRATHGPESGKSQVTLREALKALAAKSLDAREPAAAGSGMHSVPVWQPRHYEMVAAIPANSGRAAWENDHCPRCDALADANAAECANCGAPLPRPIVEEDGRWRLIRGFRTSSYKRMKPDRPAATITTASGHIGSDVTLHPSENRLLSPLECAHLQTLPKDFDWGEALDKWGTTNVRAMIGEAVPPLFTRQHGQVLAGLLTGAKHRPAISRCDDRVVRAVAALDAAEKATMRAAGSSR